MSALDMATFPVAEASKTSNANITQGAVPMNMRVESLLNPLDPLVGTSVDEPSPMPAAPTPSTSATAVAAPGDHAVGATTLDNNTQPLDNAPHDRAASPAPSTGDAPSAGAGAGAPASNGSTDTTDAEMNDGAEDLTYGGASSETITEYGTENNRSEDKTTTAGAFRCMNDEFEECRTGQVTMDLSRKVISDHFGRNKACTRLITDWPLFCRKHYQRATYNQKLWQARKINLILRQFDIIESQFPGTKYTVAFKKSEEQRLNTFSRKLASGMTEEDAAALVAAEKGKHFEAPVNVLREIEQLNYLGEDKTKTEVEGAVNTIRDMLENEETDQVPSIEFLPQLNPDGTPYDFHNRRKTPKKAAARVSVKGKITKPTKPSSSKTPKKSVAKL